MMEKTERSIVINFEKYPIEGIPWIAWIEGKNCKAVVQGKDIYECIREIATSLQVCDLMDKRRLEEVEEKV